MYNVKNFMSKSPNVISAAIFAVVQFVTGCIFVAKNVDPTPEFATLMLSGNTALVLFLNLIVVQPNTVTNSQAEADVDAAVATRESEIQSFLAEAPPAVEKKVRKKVAATAKKAPARA